MKNSLCSNLYVRKYPEIYLNWVWKFHQWACRCQGVYQCPSCYKFNLMVIKNIYWLINFHFTLWLATTSGCLYNEFTILYIQYQWNVLPVSVYICAWKLTLHTCADFTEINNDNGIEINAPPTLITPHHTICVLAMAINTYVCAYNEPCYCMQSAPLTTGPVDKSLLYSMILLEYGKYYWKWSQ